MRKILLALMLVIIPACSVPITPYLSEQAEAVCVKNDGLDYAYIEPLFFSSKIGERMWAVRAYCHDGAKFEITVEEER